MKRNKNQIKLCYQAPKIRSKKISIRLFTNPEFLSGVNLLTDCSYCNGTTCPPECSTTCFLPKTKILTEQGEINFEILDKNAHIILSYDMNGKKLVKSKIEEIIVHPNVYGYIVINDRIQVTSDHRFWVNDKDWVIVKDLKIGDRLFTYHLQSEEVKSIKKIDKEVTVYNLELEGPYHNYFAEGVLVHNWK